MRLSPVPALLLVLAAAGSAEARRGREGRSEPTGPRELRQPIRWTAGDADDMDGILGPEGSRLYFVSDRNATSEIFVRVPGESGTRLLFDNHADATTPRPGPEGDRLLFLSYRNDSKGDACIRNLEAGTQRCLTDSETADVDAFWFPDGRHVGVVSRRGLHADFRLRRIPLDAPDRDRVLVERNLANPAVSPDGRWLAWVPVLQESEQVGIHFAMQAGRGLELRRTDGSGEVLRFEPRLPGATGFPAFGPEGEYLYFTQYLNDTNFDGTIDGEDHGVVFRVPFDPDADRPLAPARPVGTDDAPAEASPGKVPEQLTSARWNCQYPAPAGSRLVITCAHLGSLDVFALPLDGSVPASWSAKRVAAQQHVAPDPWERLLLLAQRLSRLDDPSARVDVLRRMTAEHAALGEHASARHYAGRVREAPGASEAEVAWAKVMEELVGHRRREVALTSGKSSGFRKDARKRLARLDEITGTSDDVDALVRLVRSEIRDTLGDEARAMELLESVAPERPTDPLVLGELGRRGAAMYRPRHAREKLLELRRTLATHDALPHRAHVRHARAFIRDVRRGRGREARREALDRWLDRIDEDTALSGLLGVERELLRLDPEGEERVREGVFELYKRHDRIPERRAIVLRTVREAARRDNEYLLYQFANTWVGDLGRRHPARPHAEDLYRHVVLERAYGKRAAGKPAKARGDFFAVTLQLPSLEAHVGFVETRLTELRGKAGETTTSDDAPESATPREQVRAAYERRFSNAPDHPVRTFVDAYLRARRLPEATGEAASSEQRAVLADLRRAERDLGQRASIEHVRGYVHHLAYLRTGDREHAVDARTAYRIAVDLARDNPRYRAQTRQQLALLQASVGNHHRALDHFRARADLPFVEPAERLAFLMTSARSLFHVDRTGDAAARADEALKLIDRHPDLEHFRPMARDRAALYHRVHGDGERALELYDRVAEAMDASPDAPWATTRNRLALEVGRASAALLAERPEQALGHVERAREVLEAGPLEGKPRVAPTQRVFRDHLYNDLDYRILLAGLEARAHRARRAWSAAASALESRLEALERRHERRGAQADLEELAGDHRRLARAMRGLGRLEPARAHLEQGLEWASRYHEATGSPTTPVRRALLRDYAELHLDEGVPLSAFERDLVGMVRELHRYLARHRNPSWRAERFLFESYRTMLELGADRPSAPSSARAPASPRATKEP